MPRSYLVGLIIRLGIGFLILVLLGFILYRRFRPARPPEQAASPTTAPTSVVIISPTPGPSPTNLPHVKESPTPSPQPPQPPATPTPKETAKPEKKDQPDRRKSEVVVDEICCDGYIIRTYMTVEVEEETADNPSVEARSGDAWASAGPGWASASAGW